MHGRQSVQRWQAVQSRLQLSMHEQGPLGGPLREAGGLPAEEPMSAYKFGTAYRPLMAGTRHIVSAGHYLAAQTGLMILEAGGNAIDAGVAAGLTLNVVEPQMCCFTGVAPIMIYLPGGNGAL